MRRSFRLKKMYIRDSSGVFRAVEGFEYGDTHVYVSKSVYTIASTILDDETITLRKLKN